MENTSKKYWMTTEIYTDAKNEKIGTPSIELPTNNTASTVVVGGNTFELPLLTGSDKQIAWAIEIRNKLISECVSIMEYVDYSDKLTALLVFLVSKTDAEFFINGRNKFVDVNEMAHNFKRNKFAWTTFAGNDMNRIQF